MSIWKKDSYIVAAAPAFVFLSVYFYEWGRYNFYKVPSIFISLPTTRVLMAGMAIAFFFAMLFGFVRGILRRMRSAGVVLSIFSSFLVSYLLFGLPFALISVSKHALLSTFIFPIGFMGLMALDTLATRLDKKDGGQSQAGELKSPGDKVGDPPLGLGGIAFIFVYGLFLISCFGNGQERMLRGNVCYGDKIVVATYGDQMILKVADKQTGVLSDSVYFHPLEGAELASCNPSIEGGGGFHGWPFNKAFDEDRGNSKVTKSH
ncbi:hypothetical protein [Stenotrophomonas sp. NPDC078853]|uniref:hypothetical protein n=1 Tax=Stenotrophomonas sp. NPDC078853 TaxID=3364534 RepID=UPI00384B1105